MSTVSPDHSNPEEEPQIPLSEDGTEAKFWVASTESKDESVSERPVTLPAAYGQARVVLLVRDPHWVFAFWEIPPGQANQILAEINRTWDQVQWVLRLYSPDKENAVPGSSWDTDIDPFAQGWYLHLSPPGASFQAEVGLRDPDGHFRALACSNMATLPPDRPSTFSDEKWAVTEADHELHYAGLPVVSRTVTVNPEQANPELVAQWEAGKPASRPNPFLKK